MRTLEQSLEEGERVSLWLSGGRNSQSKRPETGIVRCALAAAGNRVHSRVVGDKLCRSLWAITKVDFYCMKWESLMGFKKKNIMLWLMSSKYQETS